MLNYLARLGWSHGDDEMFQPRAVRANGSTARPPRQEPGAVGHRPSCNWVNAHYIKQAPTSELGCAGAPQHWPRAASTARTTPALAAHRARCSRTAAHHWSNWPTGPRCSSSTVSRRADDAGAASSPKPSCRRCAACASSWPRSTWDKAGHRRALIKATAGRARPEDAAAGACAVRVLVCGRAQTPSLDARAGAVPARRQVLARLQRRLRNQAIIHSLA